MQPIIRSPKEQTVDHFHFDFGCVDQSTALPKNSHKGLASGVTSVERRDREQERRSYQVKIQINSVYYATAVALYRTRRHAAGPKSYVTTTRKYLTDEL